MNEILAEGLTISFLLSIIRVKYLIIEHHCLENG